ncbi:MAG TPA: exonuclease SbcCD subunit D [Candidatus Nanoarchaeia archaeon]|nr:exonuclease SbcCD subunit D [Candidatus Nanoarchaeia archaeon]
MRFGHIGDCHLGGWREPEMLDLNTRSFQHAVDKFIKEKLDFVLIAGDLFDSAYPPIEVMKEVFNEFRKLKESNIPVFLIAGSHDYSVSGKTFLDVLEKAGFAKNVFQPEERNNVIFLNPVIYKNVAIYGYPGKKSALEVEEIARIKLHDAPGLFKILMLHTALRDAVGALPIAAVDQDKLPPVDYVALAHLHVRYQKKNRVYCGPLFPNNVSELEELRGGSFYIADTTGKIERHEIHLKEVIVLEIDLADGVDVREMVRSKLASTSVKDAVVILKLRGVMSSGQLSHLNLAELEFATKKDGAYAVLRDTSRLYAQDMEVGLEQQTEQVESLLISRFKEEHPAPFNQMIESLIFALQIEKKEDERTQLYENRLLNEVQKLLGI